MDSSKSLKSSKFMVSSDFGKLWKSTERLEMLIDKDRSIADLLDPCVMRRLVQILKIIDREIIESECISILSRARFDKCHDDIKEEVLSHFVKLMDFNHYPQFVDEVVIALTRLAYANPDYVQYIVKIGALNAALKICGVQRGPVSGANDTIDEVAKFLVAVCRGENLSREKFSYNQVKVTLTISDNLFQQKFKSTCHIERTCYALSYLTFEREVPIEGEAFSRLIRLIYHDDYSVAGSALGVVGNIARWGNHKQIQYMAEDSELLQNLGQRWLRCKFMMFKKEACQIISNIAALSETISAALGERFRQNMQIARLIGPLCKLLQGDESDLKVEAACSLFNSIYGGTYVETIDKNDKDTLMAT